MNCRSHFVDDGLVPKQFYNSLPGSSESSHLSAFCSRVGFDGFNFQPDSRGYLNADHTLPVAPFSVIHHHPSMAQPLVCPAKAGQGAIVYTPPHPGYSIDRLLDPQRPTISPALLHVIEAATSAPGVNDGATNSAAAMQQSTDQQSIAILADLLQQHTSTPPNRPHAKKLGDEVPPLPQLNSFVSSIGGNQGALSATNYTTQNTHNGADQFSDPDQSRSPVPSNYSELDGQATEGSRPISPLRQRGRPPGPIANTSPLGQFERPHACQDCGKHFQNNSALQKHRLIHSDERKFACPVCRKAFKRHDHLSGHMNVHKPVKPFPCVVDNCDKSYCDGRSLRRHLEHTHNFKSPEVHSSRGMVRVECADVVMTKPMNVCHEIQPTEKLGGSTSASRRSTPSLHGDLDAVKPRQDSPEDYDELAADTLPVHSAGDVGNASSVISSLVGSAGDMTNHRSVQCNMCSRIFKNIPALNGHMRLHSQTKKSKDGVHLTRFSPQHQSMQYIDPHQRHLSEQDVQAIHEVMNSSQLDEALQPSGEYAMQHASGLELSRMQPLRIDVGRQMLDPHRSIGSNSSSDTTPYGLPDHSYVYHQGHFASPGESASAYVSPGHCQSALNSPYATHSGPPTVSVFAQPFDQQPPPPSGYNMMTAPNARMQEQQQFSTGVLGRASHPVGSGSENIGMQALLDSPEYRGLQTLAVPTPGTPASLMIANSNLILNTTPSGVTQFADPQGLFPDFPSTPPLVESSFGKHETIDDLVIQQEMEELWRTFPDLPSHHDQWDAWGERKRHYTAPGAISSGCSNPTLAQLNYGVPCDDGQTCSQGCPGPCSNQAQPSGGSIAKRRPSSKQKLRKRFKSHRTDVADSVTRLMTDAASRLLVSPARFRREHKSAGRMKPAPLNFSAAILNRFHSQLRSPRIFEGPLAIACKDPIPYTPPPILSPVRQGSGLFWQLKRHVFGPPKSAPISPKFSLRFFAKDSAPIVCAKDFLAPTTLEAGDDSQQQYESQDVPALAEGQVPLPTDATPHINLGPAYQAVIPVARNRSSLVNIKCPEELIFDPGCIAQISDEDVDTFLQFACSAGVQVGGQNREAALHLLHVAQGNTMRALKELMSLNRTQFKQVTFNDTVRAKWKPDDLTAFHEAILKHDKDFLLISRSMRSKTVKECVEFYYVWKKLRPDEYKTLKTARRKREGTEPITSVYNLRPCASRQSNLDQMAAAPVMASTADSPYQPSGGAPTPSSIASEASRIYHCKLCRKSFTKLKSRNAHMKSHALRGEWVSPNKLLRII